MGKTRIVAKQQKASAVTTKNLRTSDSFQNFSSRLGYGTGNQTSYGSYNVDYVSHNRQLLDSMYRSSWICGKAIDSVAEDCTKRGIEIHSVDDPAAIEEIHSLWTRLHLWDRISDTIKWARLYGGAIGVLLIDGQDLTTPLRVETVGRDSFKGLMVLDRWVAQADLTNVVREYGPELGLPAYYDVVADSRAIPRARIHYSRCIRIDGQDLPYFQRQTEQQWGQSVLERLFDRLLAFDSTTAGAAQLVYKAHLRTYKVKSLRDIIATGGPALEGLIKQMEMLRATQTNEGLTLMDTEDEFEAHTYAFGGLDTVLLQFAQQLSGALNIPLVRLFGQSPTGLNSTGESDIRTYYDGINQEQERRLRAPVEKLLNVLYMSHFGRLPPKGFSFAFRSLWQMSESEKATINATTTGAVLSADGVVKRATQLKELRAASKITGIWTNITDEEIEEAENEPPPIPLGESDDDPDIPKPADEDARDIDDEKEDRERERAGDKRTFLQRLLGYSAKKKLTSDDEWNESDHPRVQAGSGKGGQFSSGGSGGGATSSAENTGSESGSGSGSESGSESGKRKVDVISPGFSDLHKLTKEEIASAEYFQEIDAKKIARAEKRLADDPPDHPGILKERHEEIADMRADMQKRADKLERLKRHERALSKTKNEIKVAKNVQVDDGVLATRLYRNVTATLHEKEFLPLAKSLEKKGYLKDLKVGAEVWDAPPLPEYDRAIGLAHWDGRISMRDGRKPRDKTDTAKAWTRHSTGAHETDESRAQFSTFVHEVGHLYHFNDSSFDVNEQVETLFKEATENDTLISEYAGTNTFEYFAESFASRVMAPKILKQRDPKMYEFMTGFLQKHGILGQTGENG